MSKYPHLLSPEDVANKLGVKPEDIIFKIKSGELAAMEFGKGKNKVFKITNKSYSDFLNTNSRFFKRPKSLRKHGIAKPSAIKQEEISFKDKR